MRRMRHIRGFVLMLQIFGWLLVVFPGLDAIRCIVGMALDGAVVAYIGDLINSGIWCLIGVVLLIVASVVKKKHVNAGTWK